MSSKNDKLQLGLCIVILLITLILMYAYFNRWFSFSYFIGPLRAIHYIAIAGTLYVAVSVPLIALLKRRYPQKYVALTKAHVFMNLFCFLLISLHFVGQLGRPAEFYPELGTGLALYIAMVLQVLSGLIIRFSSRQSLKPLTSRSLHIGLALVFYIVIVIHFLHGFNII